MSSDNGDDKVIRFPGAARSGGTKPTAGKTGAATKADAAAKPGAPTIAGPGASAKGPDVGPDGLTEDQRKAIQVILSGMTFVFVGIKPSDRGADFYTSVHGDPSDLRNAQDHLAGVIARAYARKGL